MKFYKIILNTKQFIEIDEDDFEKIKKEMGSGNLIKVKQGIVNPSYIVAILPIEKDKEKIVKGYIDPIKNVFVVEEEEERDFVLQDEFPSREIARN